VIALLGLALFCIPLLFLNSKGHFILSASLFCLFVLIAINVNMFDGDGVHDAGILAYPILILFGALFFGKRASPIISLAAIGSLVAIVYLEIHGYVHPTIGATEFDVLIPIAVLLLGASAVTWIIVRNLEKNLERVKASDAELRKNYDLTLEAWAKVLEYRDRETEGHSRRLVELSTGLARALGLGEEEITHLRRGAQLHDIGKLAIPDHILLKPAALDDSEREMIQKHPLYAKQMLSEIPFLQPAISVAYSHHEQWDGHGYPEGSTGKEIPLLARIFAVVDTWDALCSERPYRQAWSAEEATAYIKKNAGIKFDPHIVEVFLQITSNENVA
jgi:HD-GYP domain-containing protein (c-di-GMP phosphodiesterase class II)